MKKKIIIANWGDGPGRPAGRPRPPPGGKLLPGLKRRWRANRNKERGMVEVRERTIVGWAAGGRIHGKAAFTSMVKKKYAARTGRPKL